VDVIKVATEAQAAFADRQIPLQIAVMGCIVNGPGEARDADLGIAAGRGKGHLFVRGKIVRVVPEAEMVAALVAEAEAIMTDGVDAVLARADVDAEAISAAAREELIQIQGPDANRDAQRIERVRAVGEPDAGDPVRV
jgi:(E)-4-hydroxy-3-methylbut-2-enyl-diphosphate synthase